MSGTLAVPGGRPLVGTVAVPGDKSISHRALLLAAVAEGTSVVRGLSDGDDVRRTADAVTALGARIDGSRVTGGGDVIGAPAGPLDVGNSGTTIRLLAGLVAGWDFTVVMGGDASLSRRPMDRVAVPLRLMGATVEGGGERCFPPITVRGGNLRAIDYTPPMASAQVKSCVLLAGLRAAGETIVREPVLTRRHTEELLALCGAAVDEEDDDGTHVVRLRGGDLEPFEVDVPGDPSQAAFWVVAACVVPGSEITMERVYVGPGRRGFLDVLLRMGADVDEDAVTGPGDLAATATVQARSGPLRATTVEAGEITGLDEVPVLAVAAARAEGTTVFHGVGELRVKESDRLAAVVSMVRAFGAAAEADGDDLVVHGAPALTAGTFDAGRDHRMAMAAAVAGMAVAAGKGPSLISGFESVVTSYPRFADHLDHLSGTDGGRGADGGRGR
ncbi:MAG TPA: 3-phosphoshikimate 1-carboxyvinyltransferase [Acidimicrobiales bacterium]|nr:3-phosphoshikimate 1-carboxyvinyltransferase [Acidimicrobiales bacterium]